MERTGSLLAMYTALGLLAASCATMRPTAGVQDDIYYMPSQAPAVAAAPAAEAPPTGSKAQGTPAGDDYYDPEASRDMGTHRNYYDMAYNDPYYYNYGRFGFGGGMGTSMMMGWQTGWNAPGWGMGMGYGFGHPMGSGWSMSMAYGTGFYDPWYGGWGGPYMDPWYRPFGYRPMGFYDPYMGGYGWGNYYGPYGNCFACYAPVVVGGSSGLVVGHRPSMTGAGGTNESGTVTQPRNMIFRDPVGLAPSVRSERDQRSTTRSFDRPQQQRTRNIFGTPDRSGGTRSNDGGREIQRSGGFERGGGIQRGGGGSRSGGGGGGTITSPRPR